MFSRRLQITNNNNGIIKIMKRYAISFMDYNNKIATINELGDNWIILMKLYLVGL